MTSSEENAETLRYIADQGRDLTKSYLVDFVHVFETQLLAHSFAEAASKRGFGTAVSEDSEAGHWEVTASRMMVPTCEVITSTERDLDALARSFCGYADGWGFLSSSVDPL